MREPRKKAVHPEIQPLLGWCRARFAGTPALRKVTLFGSFARGDATRSSDVDLALEIDDPAALAPLVEALQSGAPTLRKLDCVDFRSAPEALREKIEAEGEVVYERAG